MSNINKISEIFVVFNTSDRAIADGCTYRTEEAAKNVCKHIQKDYLDKFKDISCSLKRAVIQTFQVITLENAIELIKISGFESGLYTDIPNESQ